MAAEYTYQPIYGVEPWQNNAGVPYPASYGGGAKLTGQNLIISMWTQPGVGAEQLLVPLPYTPEAAGLDTVPGYVTKGLLPAFNSRTSARFRLGVDDEFVEFDMLAILNPPSDLKTQLQNCVKANVNVVPLGFEVLKSYLGLRAFEFYATDGKSTPIFAQILFSDLIVPTFYATSGADGTPPVPLPSLAAGLPAAQATVDALNSGNFYIGANFVCSEIEGVFTINWPHTSARG